MSIGLIVVIVIVAILVIWFIAMYNGFVKIKNRVDEAFATIDVYLKKRYDLIPNLVETVKGYAAHESGTLEKVVQARSIRMVSSISFGSQRERKRRYLSIRREKMNTRFHFGRIISLM